MGKKMIIIVLVGFFYFTVEVIAQEKKEIQFTATDSSAQNIIISEIKAKYNVSDTLSIKPSPLDSSENRESVIHPEKQKVLDVLYFKDGKIVKGKIIRKSLFVIDFQHQSGEMETYSKSSISEITQEKYLPTQSEAKQNEVEQTKFQLNTQEVSKLAIIGFKTPRLNAEPASTYIASNELMMNYWTNVQVKKFGYVAVGYSWTSALANATVSALASAIFDAWEQASEEVNVANEMMRTIVPYNNIDTELISAIQRNLASEYPFEIVVLHDTECSDCIDDSIASCYLKKGLQAVIEVKIKDFDFFYQFDGVQNSFTIVVDIKFIETLSGINIFKKTYPYYGIIDEDNGRMIKRSYGYYRNRDNIIKEMDKAILILTQRILGDIAFQ